MAGRLSRIQRLARRVGWLDRYRRLVAIAVALFTAPLLISELGETLGSDWPQMHVTLLAAMLGAVVWCVVEVGLAWLTALWETEHHRLMRDGGLPVARMLRRKP